MANILNNLTEFEHGEKNVHLAGRMSGEERRRQLIEAGAEVFSQKGFSGATTKEIAAIANINEAMIFRHFGGKEALYDAVISEKFAEFQPSEMLTQMREAAERNDDTAVFETAARVILHRYTSKRDILRILIFGILEHRHHIIEKYEAQLSPLHNFLEEYINKRQAEGAFYTENSALVIFGFLGVITHYVTLGELIGNERKPATVDDAIRIYTQTFLDSLKKK